MQSQSWVFLKFSFFSPILQFSFLLFSSLHSPSLIIHQRPFPFVLRFPHLWEEATFTNFHDQSPFSFSDRNSTGPSLCSHLYSVLCLFSSLFLLLFRFSLFCHPSFNYFQITFTFSHSGDLSCSFMLELSCRGALLPLLPFASTEPRPSPGTSCLNRWISAS